MQMQTHSTPTSIKLPVKLRDRIQNLAKVRKRTPHSLMIQALETYVAREEQRESLRQEARAAHEEYMMAGLHLTQEEMEVWIAKIARDEKAPLPKCHV